MFEKIRDVLAKQFELDPETITRDTNLIDDIGADSLDIVELIMALEDEFGIKISDEDAVKLDTVEQKPCRVGAFTFIQYYQLTSPANAFIILINSGERRPRP